MSPSFAIICSVIQHAKCSAILTGQFNSVTALSLETYNNYHCFCRCTFNYVYILTKSFNKSQNTPPILQTSGQPTIQTHIKPETDNITQKIKQLQFFFLYWLIQCFLIQTNSFLFSYANLWQTVTGFTQISFSIFNFCDFRTSLVDIISEIKSLKLQAMVLIFVFSKHHKCSFHSTDIRDLNCYPPKIPNTDEEWTV